MAQGAEPLRGLAPLNPIVAKLNPVLVRWNVLLKWSSTL